MIHTSHLQVPLVQSDAFPSLRNSNPMDHLLDGLGRFTESVEGVVSKAGSVLGHDSSVPQSRDVVLKTAFDPQLGHTSEEWQVAQGMNREGVNYTTYRHRSGMLIELCHESSGSFNYKLSDGMPCGGRGCGGSSSGFRLSPTS